MQGFKVAVAGATGNVGREMLKILAERRFPVSEVVALASSRSIGKEVSFGDRILKCKALENYDFSTTDICLMSAGGAVSKEWSPKIGAQGCVVHCVLGLRSIPGQDERRKSVSGIEAGVCEAREGDGGVAAGGFKRVVVNDELENPGAQGDGYRMKAPAGCARGVPCDPFQAASQP